MCIINTQKRHTLKAINAIATTNTVAPALIITNISRSTTTAVSFASSTKNEGVIRDPMFSAMRLLPADDPLRQPPENTLI